MKAVPASRYLVFIAIVIGGCLADLLSKRWAFEHLGMPGGPTLWLWQGVVGFQTSLNEGALFGVGQGQVALFAALSIAAMIGILTWLFVTGAARDWWLTICLASVTAGILGNLYDRVGLPGLYWNYANDLHELHAPVFAVRDWILVMIGPWGWPNFNLADPMLVCGAITLAWHALAIERKPNDGEPPASAHDDEMGK